MMNRGQLRKGGGGAKRESGQGWVEEGRGSQREMGRERQAGSGGRQGEVEQGVEEGGGGEEVEVGVSRGWVSSRVSRRTTL